MTSSNSLVRKIREGNPDAFELLYRMEFLNLVHFSNSYLQDTEKARDISQESLLSLWENRERLDPDKNIRAFLFTIARNKTLDELARRRFFCNGSAEYDKAIALLEDHSVDTYISQLDLSALMESIRQSLPSKIERTLALSREEGLRNKEIAREEGISEKAVEYRMKIALRHCRKLFEKFF